MNSSTLKNAAIQLISTSGYEWRLGCRTPAWRLLTVAFFLYGFSIGHVDGRWAGGSAYATAEAGWKFVSFAAIIWMSILGTRETVMRTKIIVFVKPQASERLVIARFLGAMAQLIAFLLAMFAGSILARILAGTAPALLLAYIPQFLRSLSAVFFLSAFSFTLAILADNVGAGMLVCLYLVLIMAGKSFLPKMLDPSPIQNNGAYVALAAAILCLAIRFYGDKRRGSSAVPVWISSAGIALVGISGWLFFVIGSQGHDSHIHENLTLNTMQTQDTSIGLRAAGYLLPDQDGKPSDISQFGDSIFVIALWSPLDPDSEQLLIRLNAIQNEYHKSGVQVVAVCLSEDNSAARTFALGDDLHFPVVTDWGTVSVPEKLAMSPIASAYRTSILPMVAVTDRRRRILDIIRGSTCYDGNSVNTLIQHEISEDQ